MFQQNKIVGLQSTVPVFPEANSVDVLAVSSREFRCGCTSVQLFENADDLRVGEGSFSREFSRPGFTPENSQSPFVRIHALRSGSITAATVNIGN